MRVLNPTTLRRKAMVTSKRVIDSLVKSETGKPACRIEYQVFYFPIFAFAKGEPPLPGVQVIP
jgi:hypothetical protein